MPSLVFGVTYDGASFYGWQRQPDFPTVQGELEAAVTRVADSSVNIIVAGRTDTGVHATGQVAGFSCQTNRSLHEWHRGLNALTPKSISVDWVQTVDETFHPRYSATARTYSYVFHDIGRKHPMLLQRVWGCQALDADAMHRAAQCLIGEHDFSSFRGAGCQSTTPMRRVNRCAVFRRGAFVVLEIEANAFVMHMVRNIASALHDVGCGHESMSINALLDVKDRTLLGPTAPPDGLYLVDVSYPNFELPKSAGIPFISL
jgi:tRNA pseudouridine38-40 synthase